jgi:hypothetical protein
MDHPLPIAPGAGGAPPVAAIPGGPPPPAPAGTLVTAENLMAMLDRRDAMARERDAMAREQAREERKADLAAMTAHFASQARMHAATAEPPRMKSARLDREIGKMRALQFISHHHPDQLQEVLTILMDNVRDEDRMDGDYKRAAVDLRATLARLPHGAHQCATMIPLSTERDADRSGSRRDRSPARAPAAPPAPPLAPVPVPHAPFALPTPYWAGAPPAALSPAPPGAYTYAPAPAAPPSVAAATYAPAPYSPVPSGTAWAYGAPPAYAYAVPPPPAVAASADAETRTCNYCKTVGHLVANCPRKKPAAPKA